MSPEIYARLTATITEELADDWSPHDSIICHINRALEREESSEVTADTLMLLKRIIEGRIAIPGELDPNLGFRFIPYEGNREEVWSRVERQLPVGHRTRYERHLWFDNGARSAIF